MSTLSITAVPVQWSAERRRWAFGITDIDTVRIVVRCDDWTTETEWGLAHSGQYAPTREHVRVWLGHIITQMAHHRGMSPLQTRDLMAQLNWEIV